MLHRLKIYQYYFRLVFHRFIPELSMTDKPRLLDRVRRKIRIKHYSIRTEQAYIDWIRRFILFHKKRHSIEMAETEVKAFLTYLGVDRKVADSTHDTFYLL